MSEVLYTQEEFLADYDAALKEHTVPGYPAYDERLRMDDASDMHTPDGGVTLPYDADAPWCPADFYPTHASKPQTPDQFIDQGGNYPATAQEAQEWQEFGVRTDQRGMPVHPFAEAIVAGGETTDGQFVQPGGVVTPGYYYQRGPRKTSDLLLMAPDDNGTVHGLLVERKDNGLLAIPGGHVDPEDGEASAATNGRLSEYEIAGIRELAEEAGVVIDDAEMTCSGLTVALKKVWAGPGADQRATLHAWPQGEGFVGVLPSMPSQRPAASSDAKMAGWHPMSEETLTRLARFSSHGTIGRRAVAAYEQATGVRLDAYGNIR